MQLERLDKKKIVRGLGQSIFSKNIIIHEKIGSTNLFAKELAKSGAIEGTLILAEEQTKGRGRMDRPWLSQAYKNLLFSILVRPKIPIEQVFGMMMITAMAVVNAVKDLYDLDARIKWPNDIYVENRKLGGILTEFSSRQGKIEYVIVGLGLNVNWRPEESDEISYPVTSIMAETGAESSRNELLIKAIKRFYDYYRELISGRIDDLYNEWNKFSMVIGREVKIHSNEGIIEGLVVEIDRSGALILRDEKGLERRIVSGDVSLRV